MAFLLIPAVYSAIAAGAVGIGTGVGVAVAVTKSGNKNNNRSESPPRAVNIPDPKLVGLECRNITYEGLLREVAKDTITT